jgi:DNA-binding LacI/PurR family transcriptional regulator
MNMRTTNTNLEQFLDVLVREARMGDRLPTIRELMSRFGVSQIIVQQAFRNLKVRGLIASHVGRGTYFCGDGSLVTSTGLDVPDINKPLSGKTTRSVLLLRRSISIARGRVVVEGLQTRFVSNGHRVLEVSYTDPEHALTVLKGLPRFDACVIQSSFKTITINLLSALKERSTVLAVDGAALIGADVEAVGVEWGEPLATAIDVLRQQGHRRIVFASSSQPFLAAQLGHKQFAYLQKTMADMELTEIGIPHLPNESYTEALIENVRNSLDSKGRLPYTAMVVWGIEDGAKFREMMFHAGIAIPAQLSVILLGRTDLENEHANFFYTIGCSVADQIEYLYQAIQAHWADAATAYGVKLLPVTTRTGKSVHPLE